MSEAPEHHRRPRLPALVGVAVALALAASVAVGCSGERAGGGGGGGGGDAGGGAPAAGAVRVADAAGEVALPGPARRVVALEWVYAEGALALGVVPVGVADVEGYRGYVGAPPELPADVADVGTRQAPSLERIRALQPDLIVGAAFRHAAIRGDLEAIAPTLLFDAYRTDVGQLDEMEATFAALGTALGRGDQAAQVLADLDRQLAEGAEALAGLPDERRRLVVVQGYVAAEVPVLRVFTDQAMAVQLLAELGLVNAWDQPGDQYGFTTTDLEGLTGVADVTALTTASDRQLEASGITDNPLWQAWPPVRAGRVHALGGDTWTYGGPSSARLLVERVVDALAPR